MTKVNSVRLTFNPTDNSRHVGGWAIKPLPFNGNKSEAVVLFTGGTPGTWEAEPGPFIVTKDPIPPSNLVTVFDSTTIKTIGRLSSTSRQLVAAYDDGFYNNVLEAQKDYPNHEVVTIAVRYGDKAMWGDCEHYDLTGIAAIDAYKDGYLSKGIYASKATWDTILIPILSAHYPNLHPMRWVADWTGEPHLPILSDGRMADACQWDNHVIGRVNVDVSLFSEHAL